MVVETAEDDGNGKPMLKKGKPILAKGKTDAEIIPLQESIKEYFETNVLPFNPLAFMDRTKDKVGYEIPFTRIFYKFIEPRKSEDIFAEFKALSEEEARLMEEILRG